MADKKYLRRDGFVEWRPDQKTVKHLQALGGQILGGGAVCTACLVGDWPLTQLRQMQVLCHDCDWLLEQSVGRRIRPVTDEAKAYRRARVRELFDRAQEAGIETIDLDLGRDVTERAIEYGVLSESGLLPDDWASRIARLADWADALLTHQPEARVARAALTADVPALSARAEARTRDVARQRARVELEDACKDVREASARLTAALARVLKVGVASS